MQGVTLKAVGKRFGNATAVDSVSLSVAPGEFVTLLGPSGCGKTTTLRMVAGLEQNDSGVISIGDRVVSDPLSGTYVAPEKRQLGMVFQSYAIWPHMTVFDNVAYPLRVRRAPADVIRQKVHAALALVEMTDYADRPAPRLSGGQQQRVAIARAMVFEPQVLLLDEPLSNLDAKLRAQMGEEFRALQHRLRITCLYVTHDQEEAMALSDRIVVMQHGRVLQVGDPRSIYQRPTTRAVAAFFGSPNLIDAVVENCDLRSDGLYTLQVNAQGWRGSCLAGETFKIGDPVVVMIRPESLQVTTTPAADTGATDPWRGEIIDSIFRGARCSVVVRMGHLRLVAEAPSLRAAPIGTHVCLFAEATEAWALRPESHSHSHESKAGERP